MSYPVNNSQIEQMIGSHELEKFHKHTKKPKVFSRVMAKEIPLYDKMVREKS